MRNASPAAYKLGPATNKQRAEHRDSFHAGAAFLLSIAASRTGDPETLDQLRAEIRKWAQKKRSACEPEPTES